MVIFIIQINYQKILNVYQKIIELIILNYLQEEKVIEEKIIKPYNYQLEAVNKFIKYFKTNNQGILSLPCGTGKTYTSYLISEKYNKIIIISPLKQFAKQNLDRFIEYGFIS